MASFEWILNWISSYLFIYFLETLLEKSKLLYFDYPVENLEGKVKTEKRLTEKNLFFSVNLFSKKNLFFAKQKKDKAQILFHLYQKFAIENIDKYMKAYVEMCMFNFPKLLN